MPEDNNLIKRTDEEQKRSIEIYDSYKDELLKRQLSNTENYDKSILTLSSAGLAISLTFLKFVVPLHEAQHLWLMKTSWLLFLFSIIFSLIAFLVSNSAITKQLNIAEDYYVNKKKYAFNQRNWLSSFNNWLNYAVGLLFSVAITTIVVFVILNFHQKDIDMSDKKTKTSESQPAMESATIPIMQKVSVGEFVTDSAEIPTMQAAPSSTSQPQEAKPAPSQVQEKEDNK